MSITANWRKQVHCCRQTDWFQGRCPSYRSKM